MGQAAAATPEWVAEPPWHGSTPRAGRKPVMSLKQTRHVPRVTHKGNETGHCLTRAGPLLWWYYNVAV